MGIAAIIPLKKFWQSLFLSQRKMELHVSVTRTHQLGLCRDRSCIGRGRVWRPMQVSCSEQLTTLESMPYENTAYIDKQWI